MATLFWAAGLAILFGAWTQDGEWVLAGAVLGYLVGRQFTLAGRIETAEKRLAGLTGLAAQPVTPVAPAAARPAPDQPAAEPVFSSPPTVSAPPPAPVGSTQPQPAMPSATPWPPSTPAEPGIFDRGIALAVDWFKRGNPLARVGIVVLFFGGSFLAKYSADRGFFPIEVRFIGLALGAIALLVLGWRMRHGKRGFALTLQGGGVASLYLTLFAATKLFKLLPPGLSLPLLIAVAAASALLAVAQNSLALATIGTAGGFMAPILLSTGSGNHVALFTYYAILNAGVFTVAWFRSWQVLNLVGFVFTFGIAGLFRGTGYTDDKLLSTDFFLLLYFLMYAGIAVLFSLRQKPELKGYVSGTLVFGLPLVVFGLHATMVSRYEFALAWSALGFGAFYLTLAYALYRRGPDSLRLLAEAFIALGVIFASLAIPLAFDRQTTAAMWAIEGAGLLWIGLRQGRKFARAFGFLLQVCGGAGYLAGLHKLDGAPALLNSAYIGSLMLAVAGLVSGWWLVQNKLRLAAYEKTADVSAALWALFWWLLGGLFEIDRSVTADWHYGGALLYGAATVILLHVLGRRLTWPVLQPLALCVIAATSLGGLAFGLRAHHPLADGGWLAWPAVLLAGLAVMRRLADDSSLTAGLRWLHVGVVWLVALLAAWELSWQLREHIGGVWPVLPWGIAPAAALWVVTRAPRLWPFTSQADAHRLAARPLFYFCALWVAAANLSQNGNPALLPYLPLLNPLDVASALVLLATAHYLLALGQNCEKQLGLPARILWAGGAALIFLWLNSALLRALHHLAGTPLLFDGISRSVLVQASLSIFWGLLGLCAIAVSAWQQQRVIWIVGAALMGVVVAKLFLLDLSGTGTLARIVSFLGVGALLLLAGYLAPLPPTQPVSKEQT